ncbi:MAG: type I restriction endonuclease [Chloroflexi bacterium]|nr:type I restriction endonuclease [Chloroflexota bacterium]
MQLDFIDEVRTRSARFAKRIEHLDSEEATKTSLVLPFIQMLGYSIFDPLEVAPEYVADIGMKKHEKVDYALLQENGDPAVLIECKPYGSSLDEPQESQLFRYFTAVTKARFGILTDGVTYRFFGDLDKPNMMDTRPFLEFNMLAFTEHDVEQLKLFTKPDFRLDGLVDAAREMKYATEIKRVLTEEMAEPSDEFVRFIARRVYSGLLTKSVREQFALLIRGAFAGWVNDLISDRLKGALERDVGPSRDPRDDDADDREAAKVAKGDLECTPLELEALEVVRDIVKDLVDGDRITLRPYRHYCSVALDDSWVIFRLRLKTQSLRLILEGDKRRETRLPLDGVNGLHAYTEQIRAALIKRLPDSGEPEMASGVP